MRKLDVRILAGAYFCHGLPPQLRNLRKKGKKIDRTPGPSTSRTFFFSQPWKSSCKDWLLRNERFRPKFHFSINRNTNSCNLWKTSAVLYRKDVGFVNRTKRSLPLSSRLKCYSCDALNLQPQTDYHRSQQLETDFGQFIWNNDKLDFRTIVNYNPRAEVSRQPQRS